MTNKEHALHYAQSGLRVFPVWNKSKAPHTPNGFFDSTCNPDIINDWWDLYPDAGIGIRIPDDIVIVDLDGIAKEAVEGMKDHGFLMPTTLWATTGSGGRHYWYRMPSSHQGMQKRSIEFLMGPNYQVDLLTNGFVVAPPSESINGKYKWHVAFDINNIVDAPQWLLDSYAAEKRWKDKIDPDEVLEGVEEGGRNTTIFRYACKLRDSGLTAAEAQVLLDTVASRCDPPLPKNEVRGMAKRIWKTYEEKKELDDGTLPKIYSLAELDSLNLPPPKFFVYDTDWNGDKKGLIPAGVTVLSSAPKVGKSALIGLVSGAIADEEEVLGFKTTRSGVLYLDLQQNPMFAKQRWSKILSYQPSNLYTAFEWKPMDKGGLDHIKQFLSVKPEIGVVIIDTLAEFWPLDDSGGGSMYRNEARVMKTFRRLSDDFGLSVILIHHETKNDNYKGTVVKRAGGTFGITGGADAVLSLSRDDNSPEGLLEVTGKNVPARKLFLKYDTTTLRWEKL